ncbi:hypothetical protein C8Q73DRAFT_277775 [Cubamyces lactineus]|nr:hypothetical protein C8Q73DRAFT_277775 [Cubamyces lactineus]
MPSSSLSSSTPRLWSGASQLVRTVQTLRLGSRCVAPTLLTHPAILSDSAGPPRGRIPRRETRTAPSRPHRLRDRSQPERPKARASRYGRIAGTTEDGFAFRNWASRDEVALRAAERMNVNASLILRVHGVLWHSTPSVRQYTLNNYAPFCVYYSSGSNVCSRDKCSRPVGRQQTRIEPCASPKSNVIGAQVYCRTCLRSGGCTHNFKFVHSFA